jgi:hypothetical protein
LAQKEVCSTKIAAEPAYPSPVLVGFHKEAEQFPLSQTSHKKDRQHSLLKVMFACF